MYRRGDQYVPEALAQVEVLLRDYRTGERHPIDPHLLDILYEVAQSIGVDPVFSVISGYRSPQTNALLHERSAEVASQSLHMEGRAIDVRLTHVDCADLADKALAMQRGGVGYYRQSDFVHLDTGRVRTWRGLSRARAAQENAHALELRLEGCAVRGLARRPAGEVTEGALQRARHVDVRLPQPITRSPQRSGSA